MKAGQAYQANAANQRAADAMRAQAAAASKAAQVCVMDVHVMCSSRSVTRRVVSQALDAMATAAAGGGTSDGERALSDAQGRLRQLVQQYKQVGVAASVKGV